MSQEAKLDYVVGNIFTGLPVTPSTKVIFHVCNDIGGWGSGFVVPLSKKWPETERSYRKWHNNTFEPFTEPFKIGEIQLVPVQGFQQCANADEGPIYVCNAIGQRSTISDPDCYVDPGQCYVRGGKRPLDYAKLATAMSKLGDALSRCDTYCEIHCPLFGSGLAGGNWDIIEKLIIDAWTRQGIPVTVYQLPGEELRDPTKDDPTKEVPNV
jgi:O-acetyl-ADP-ribose deacetylase (regulator of RNase III)